MRLRRYRKTLLLVIASFLLFVLVFHYDYYHQYLWTTPAENKSPAVYQPPKARTVLLWVQLYGKEPDVFEKCPELKCAVSYNQADLAVADAVVFPEYAIRVEMPRPAFESQKFVYYTVEALTSLMREDFLNRYPRDFFHMVVSYIYGSRVYVPYGGYGSAALPYSTPRILEPLIEESVFKDKSIKGVFGLVSNCHAASGRQQAMEALAEHITVDIAGSCATNKSFLKICPRGDSCERIFKRYYFYIAMENSLCTEYISEKLWARLHLPLIPIVLRRSLYEKHAPRNSFIAIDDYKTPMDLGDYLKYLVSNRTAYMEYFAWRNESPMHVWTAEGFSIRFCHLCRTLSASDDRSRVPAIPNITDWFMTRTQCDSMKDVVEWSGRTR